jgi:hypothetical protein
MMQVHRASSERRDVLLQHGGVDRAAQIARILWQAEQQVVVQRFAEEDWHLGRVGGARWDQKLARSTTVAPFQRFALLSGRAWSGELVLAEL